MNLPEVVPDSSLEATQASHAHYQHGWDHGEKDPKYTVAAGGYDYKSDNNAPSVHYDTGLIPVHSVHSFKIDDTGYLVPPGGAGASPGRKTICGLRPKVFWLLLGVGLVVVVASVAGGVGGGMMAARSRKENSNAQAAATSPGAVDNSSSTRTSTKKSSPSGTAVGGTSDGGNSTDGPINSAEASSPGGNASGKATGTDTSKTSATATGKPTSTNHETSSKPAQKTVTTGTTVVSTTTKQPATTPPTTAAGTTTTKAAAATTTTKTPVSVAPAPAPTFLNNQTYSLTGFAFQAFSGSDYTGKVSDVIRDEGFLDLAFSSNSYVWLPNGADCCITFCSDDTTAAGWWCDERRQKDSSSAFPRLWIGCGSSAHQEHACS